MLLLLFFFARVTAWFIFAWAVVGLVIYGGVSSDCQKTIEGKIIISWSVIKLVAAMLQMLASQTTIEDTRPDERRIEERRGEERRSEAQAVAAQEVTA